MMSISTVERRHRLGRRHFLAAPAEDIAQVAGVLGGLHATDPASVYLSGRARVSGFTRGTLNRELYEERSLLRVLGMRRTLFVVPSSAEPMLRIACAQKYLDADQRRLTAMLDDQYGHGAEWLDEVSNRTLQCLQELGSATAGELKECEPRLGTKLSFGEGKKWGGEIGLSTRILSLLAARGEIVRGRPRGSWLSGQYEWASRTLWLGERLPDPSPEEARSAIVARWLNSFGPGKLEDVKWWTGWGVRETRAALADVGAVEVNLEDGPGYVLPADLDGTEPPEDWVALLPSLDPTPMGWTHRSWFLGSHGSELFDRSGNIGPTIWANGRIVGGWGQTGDGEVVTEILEPISADERDMVEQHARSIAEWLDGDIVKPRFHTPLETRLGLG